MTINMTTLEFEILFFIIFMTLMWLVWDEYKNLKTKYQEKEAKKDI